VKIGLVGGWEFRSFAKLDGLDAHGVDDASEADDEVFLTLFGQLRF
jgi:hypothetical protein